VAALHALVGESSRDLGDDLEDGLVAALGDNILILAVIFWNDVEGLAALAG